MKKLLLLFLILNICSFSRAQDYQSFQKSYENGKELFELKRYGLAMQAFKPLTSSFNENPFIEHASFYYAVSAFYEKQHDISAAMFNQIKSNFPDWQQMDEVNLWLTKIYLEKNEFTKALSAIGSIKNAETKEYANRLLHSELQQINSIDSLEVLYNQNPSHEEIAKALAMNIAKQPILEQNRTLLFDLINKFNLDTENMDLIPASESLKKDVYNVAVLLPFMLNDLVQNRSAIRNQFVIDLYQGIQLGQEELNAMGIKLNISSYDTESSAQKTQRLLAKPEMQHFDLIYGPLYPQPVLLANQFSFDYKIDMFNPLSSNQQVVGNNPYSFLYMSTHETQGRKCAEYLLKTLKKKAGIVFYGADEKDSILAHSFAKTFYEAGDSTLYLRKIEEIKSKKIIEILTAGATVEMDPDDEGRPQATATLFKIPRDSIGFIFVASESPALASSTITAMETRGDSTILVGRESWLNNQIISYDALERLNAILIAPTYIDRSSPEYQYFETAYKEKFNTLPTKNACIGYETIILLGKLFKNYGTHFENEFDTETIKGNILPKYSLQRSNSNQYVPLIRFRDSELKIVNP